MQRSGRDRPAIATPEQAFAKALREFRRKRSISQEELGFESGYHRTYISMLERGKMNPSLRTVLSLATALNISAAEIVTRVERLLGSPWQRPQNP
jgi:transcriptional regulator with XRE-family HTH domain